MKRAIILAAIVVFGMSHLQAQKVSFGAKAGVNFTNITGNDTEDFHGRTSFHAGFLAEIPLAPKFSLQPEILFSSKGAVEKGGFETYEGHISYEAQIKLHYISLPIMAEYYFVENFSVQFGPQIGYLISAKAPEFSVSADDINLSENAKDEFKTFDFGLGIGLEYKLTKSILIQARYLLGLTNVRKPVDLISIGLGPDPIPTRMDSYQQKGHNNVFQLSVGYMF